MAGTEGEGFSKPCNLRDGGDDQSPSYSFMSGVFNKFCPERSFCARGNSAAAQGVMGFCVGQIWSYNGASKRN